MSTQNQKMRRGMATCLCLAAAFGCLLLGLTACREGRPDTWPVSHLEIPPVATNAYQVYKNSLEAKRNIIESKCVFIDGKDIQMPLTSGNFDPQDNRIYSFYIWAYDQDAPKEFTLNDLRKDGTFNVDVIGVKATITVPDYGAAGAPPQPLLDRTTNGSSLNTFQTLQSHNLLQVQINSKDISGPFTILAWFPDKYRNWHPSSQSGVPLSITNNLANANPYGEKREVKVYNGDLRTRIDIIDEREAEASFGTLFPKYFYIGRIYLRNRHPDKRMVVYTTSMRANILLYRPPVPEKPEVIPATTRGKATEPMVLSSRKQYAQADITAEQRTNLNTNLFLLSQQKTNQLVLQQMVATAFADYEPNGVAKSPNSKRVEIAFGIVTNSLNRINLLNVSNYWANTNDAVQRILLVWSRLDENITALKQEATTANADAFGLIRTELALPPAGADQDQVARINLSPVLLQLSGNGNGHDLRGSYLAATNAINQANFTAPEKARLLALVDQVYALRLHAQERAALARALAANNPLLLADSQETPIALLDEYNRSVAKIQAAALEDNGASPNPFAKARPVNVNASPRQLALSDDQDAQVQLARIGYLWHESYRPMTFQAVLNSLMYTDENSYSARTIRLLQSAATVAGGMVGLGVAVHELNSVGYLEGVTLFSTIFVPELGKLILDDVNKHVRNLGEMAMDTVVVVPPNDVVDHYVFFPKGPIYNFSDEFNVTDPAYIKNIDNDDVGIEATLIDQGVSVQGGSMDSATLVDRALNEGESTISAEMLKQADLKDRLRQLELVTITTQITTLLQSQPLGSNNVKSTQRLLVEKQICNLVKSFTAQFGEDSTGILASLLGTNQVDCVNSPPKFLTGATPPVDVLPGVISVALPLPVADEFSLAKLFITSTSSNPAFIDPTNVVIAPTATNVTFTVLAATNAAPTQDAPVTLTFVASNIMNLTASLPIHANVHTPQFTFQPQPGLPSYKDVNGVNIDLANTNYVTFMTVVLPVYDSDLSNLTNWSCRVASQTSQAFQTNGWNITVTAPQLQPLGQTGQQHQLCMGLTIDPTVATSTVLPLPITMLCGGRVIASTNLQVVAVPPVNNP